MLWLVPFIATIPAANWMIGHVGTVCPPGGPCLIPVAPGVMAPSGVLMIGLVLVLRDLVHRELGVKWAAGAIVTGAALSAFLAPPALVVASCAALLMSQFTDLAAYAPLYRRRLSCGAPHPQPLVSDGARDQARQAQELGTLCSVALWGRGLGCST